MHSNKVLRLFLLRVRAKAFDHMAGSQESLPYKQLAGSKWIDPPKRERRRIVCYREVSTEQSATEEHTEEAVGNMEIENPPQIVRRKATKIPTARRTGQDNVRDEKDLKLTLERLQTYIRSTGWCTT